MNPGEGYLVKMNAEDVLIYPEETKTLLVESNVKPKHFNIKNANPYEPVWTIYLDKGDFEKGDEIGIFDDEKLAGVALVVSDNILENAIPVFSNLYKTGNKPIIKVWDKSENEEYILSDYSFSNPYGDAWMEDVFPAEDGEYSLLHFSTTGIPNENSIIPSFTIYPNPSEGIFNIFIKNLTGFENLAGLNLEITDITGKIVFQSNETKQVRMDGSKIEIDLDELPTGVYFIKFSSKGLNQVRKIVIQ